MRRSTLLLATILSTTAVAFSACGNSRSAGVSAWQFLQPGVLVAALIVVLFTVLTDGALLQPQNKAGLTKVLTYHVVPGRVSAAELVEMIRAGGGTWMIE